MRELIRPTLFLVARLGLFLSVAAWLVGQCWTVEASSPSAMSVSIVTSKQGWAFIHRNFGARGTACRVSQPASQDQERFGDCTAFRVAAEERTYFHGGGSFQIATVGTLVAFRHWLVVTIFALFNGVLMWVYRKRGKELVADENCASPT